MIFGILGAGDAAEVRKMGALLSQANGLLTVHSPRAGVFLGEFVSQGKPVSPRAEMVLDGGIYRTGEELVCRSDSLQILQQVMSSGDLEQLNAVRGEFALAYWNDAASELLLGVDHISFKSLFYCQLEGRIAFSTEYKAFFALADFEPELDRESLQYYATVRTAMPMRPLLVNLNKVPAGSIVRLKSDHARVYRYWTPQIAYEQRSIGDWATLVERQVTRSIQQQVHDHERVGIALSGGLDSAIIAAVVAGCKPADRITAYSVGQSDDDPDILGAKQIADYLGIRHQVTYFNPEDVRKYLPAAVWMMEDCTGREETLFHLKMFDAIDSEETVIVYGLGADRLFGGMPRHKLLAMAERMPLFRRGLLELYQTTQTSLPAHSLLGKLLTRLVYRGKQFPPPRIVGVSKATRVAEPASFSEILKGDVGSASCQYLEPLCQNAHLDFRSPFCDPDCVELALKIPDNHKIHLLRQKVVLRRAFQHILPEEVMRSPKSLQRLDHSRALSDTLDKMVVELGDLEHIREHNLVAPGYLKQLLARISGKAYTTERVYRLWTLLSTEIWLRQFLNGHGRLWSFDDISSHRTPLELNLSGSADDGQSQSSRVPSSVEELRP
jgi:asparagine synthase (glutamine-hydrolysing)